MPMIALEIHLNGQKLCRAGIGDTGVLSAIVTFATRVASAGKIDQNLFIDVAGLITPERKHVSWINQKPLGVGDKIQVAIVDLDSVDEYQNRNAANDHGLRQAKEDQVRRSAKELGWKIEEPAKSTGEAC